MILPLVLTLLTPGLSQAATTETVAGHPYVTLETRRATLDTFMDQLRPTSVRWGHWYQCGPFPYAGHGRDDLRTVHGPESQLPRMRAGENPDLTQEYTGKNDSLARWEPLGSVAGQRIDMHRYSDPGLSDNVAGYLYTTIESSAAQTMEYTMGSDDGCRFWLNGELLLDVDVPRGLNPEDDRLTLELKPGANHILIEVVDGQGGWEYQILTEQPMDPAVEAHLNFLLDRDFPPSRMREFYTAVTIPIPEDLVIEVGGLDVLPDGRPALSTRRGDVYIVDGTYDMPPLAPKFELFAEGLHEPLGLEWRDEEGVLALYAVQRGELTRMVDEDGDGRADLYEAFNDDWGVSGNYHEFAFGPKFDDEGNAWITLNVGFCGSLGKSVVPWRGWALKVTPQGELIPVCTGLRSPNGIGKWKDGSMFYVDNQGDYVATNRLTHLAQGSFHGHPAGLRWRDDIESADDPQPEMQRTSIWFPYKRMGQSIADIVLDDTQGAFGPFEDQFFCGDQMMASVMRADLEIVNGHYQGACFPFIERLDSGVNRMAFAPDGSMFVGQTDRGWGSIGERSYGLQRLVWNGVTPFEVRHMTVTQDGFELEFTLDVDVESATNPASYEFETFTYEYHSNYGAPESDRREVAVVRAELLGPRRVRLTLPELRAGYVHEMHATGVRDKQGQGLVHTNAYYTLMEIPVQAQQAAADTSKPRLLFLTHSAGFVHEVVKRPSPEVLSHAERSLITFAFDQYEVLATQDCSLINATSLATFDALIFYTTGDLPIPEPDRMALIDWVANGGAFVGIHCATDTWYKFPEYGELVGGYFDGHPWHEEVRLVVENQDHPSTAHLGETWTLTDEMYQFKDWRRFPLQGLLHMDGTKTDLGNGNRADGDYVNAWCKAFGAGRMFYTGLGHRPEVWTNPEFMKHLLGGIDWAIAGPDLPTPPPAGARLLMGGADTRRLLCHADSKDAEWPEENGIWTVKNGSGSLFTREHFGDALIHLEFSPSEHGDGVTGQGRGNSGIYLMGQYELQVLDSFGIEPKMGDCGSIYGVALPSVAPYRPAGSWSYYDIEFRAPRFDQDGKKTENASLTAWLNGRMIHENVEIPGPTASSWRSDEFPMGPIMLQDHGNPVRFRNLWVLPR